ncbi:MAG TPA: hypothetical protein VG891_14090 [Rhizomicrobium sp.]|nr:hypothetical protein [Rhizomicrobium sp.]
MPGSSVEHEQFEILIAAVLTAGQLNRQLPGETNPTELLAKTLDELRAAQIVVKRNANFVPKGGR